MTLRALLATLWKRWIVVLAVAVFCVGIAAVYAFSEGEKSFVSSSTIAFLPDPEQKNVTPPESMAALLTTYAVVAQSQKNTEAAETILGHPLTGTVAASTASESLVLGITSEAASGDEAAETARAVTQALLPTIRENGVVEPSVINQPIASSVPKESRSPKLIIAVAAVLGVIAGVLLALLIENLRTPEDSSEPSHPGPALT